MQIRHGLKEMKMNPVLHKTVNLDRPAAGTALAEFGRMTAAYTKIWLSVTGSHGTNSEDSLYTGEAQERRAGVLPFNHC